ncbi:MAG TPA: hypothetical protein VER12_10205 [Polyangiaceae bacterium]|nr:hypothetical protein [Polyangiaceae bacterium]HYQ29643.1 hypothetical protein [Polyangiaceae bacterium]
MKPDDDYWLERLSASEAPELARSVGIMREQVPDASQLAALAAQLSAQGVPVVSTTPPVRGMGRVGKFTLSAGAALVGIAGVVLLLRQRTFDHRPSTPTVASAGLHEVIPAASSLPDVARRAGGILAPLPANPGAVESADPSQPPRPAGEPLAERVGSTAPSAAAPELPESPEPPAGPNLRSGSEPATGALKTLHSTSKPTTSSGAEPSVANKPSELTLLRDARLSLRTSPAQALALTEQHRQLYPRGAMAQERELIAISALASLGRHAAALSRVADFERDFPNSPYRKQVTQLAR